MDVVVGLLLFGLFAICVGIYLFWDGDSDGDLNSVYLVYEWTKHGGSKIVDSSDSFTIAQARADDLFDLHNGNDFADSWDEVRDYYVVYCHDFCEVVYP